MFQVYESYVVTAAHCFDKEESTPTMVVVDYQTATETIHDIEKVIKHHDYDKDSKEHNYDIALIKLGKSLECNWN